VSGRIARIGAASFLALLLGGSLACAEGIFERGISEFEAGKYTEAADDFRQAAKNAPASGVLYDLGNAEWAAGQTGPAVLAWERARWLDPFNRKAAGNLRYARRSAQLDAPEYSWYEICSSWLPGDWWAWLASLTFWAAVALVLLPGTFGWRRAGWKQGLAAASFALFLLTIPALIGVHTRARTGIILSKDTPLRLTPTADAQLVTRLPSGDFARLERTHGKYLFLRTAAGTGWVEQAQFARISRQEGIKEDL